MSIIGRSGIVSRRVIERLSWILTIVSGVTILAMMFNMSYEVFARYLFHRPTSWAMEVSMHILVGPVFLAAAYTLLKDGHVRAEVVITRLPERVQAVVNIITSALSLVFLLVLTWTVFDMVLRSYRGHEYSAGVFPFPLAPVYITILIGCAMFCLAMPVKIYDYFKAFQDKGGIKPSTEESKGG